MPWTSKFITSALLVLLCFSIWDRELKSTAGGDQRPAAAPDAGYFTPAQPIPVSKKRQYGQLGRGEDYRSIVVGAADVFGSGPYDLFVFPDRLFPFRGFDDHGAPRYGKPVKITGSALNGTVFTGPDKTIYGLFAAGKKIRLCRFDRDKKEFQQQALSPELDLPGGMGRALAGFIDSQGHFNVYFSIADGNSYRPPGDHHAASYIPYDGAGFWRGNITRRQLYHAKFDSLNLKHVETVSRVGQGPGEFLFNLGGMAIVNPGADQPPALVTSEKLGVFRYFEIDPQTGSLSLQKLVNDQNHVGLRHPVINANLCAVPDPETGRSHLIVGDTGRVWFYPCSGQLTSNGSPIYESPHPVMREDAHLCLGELPVISPGDVDGDGLTDLIVGNDAGQLLFVKNIGDQTCVEFDQPQSVSVGGKPLDIKAGYRGSIQGPGEGMWGYTCPTLYDWNGDGRLDVILNSIMADYMLLLQEPSGTAIAFSEPKPLYCDGLQMHLAWRSQPAITDWGIQDRLCLIALDEQNLLRQFWRIDNQNVERGELLKLKDGSPITANVDEAAGQTGRAKLVAHDWDQDGKIDLLIGASRGLSFPASKISYLPSGYLLTRQASVLFLRNIGSNAEPVFDYVKQLDFHGKRIGLGIHSCSPAPVDFGRGVIDLFVGTENGTIHYYPRETLSISTLPY
ncbi:FG-GAP repeat domain-containing protein [Gimesia algae]|uniref:FG-GAP repeat protein n=1 Tax=Gimesia algae TaxID=2527971 RepID=A0A517VMK5_9PLAN|nr:VCBS repeat-containing protein [Gimesia algae]QDT94247.1 FG-GAP repeat protein [Gimesia algae]